MQFFCTVLGPSTKEREISSEREIIQNVRFIQKCILTYLALLGILKYTSEEISRSNVIMNYNKTH